MKCWCNHDTQSCFHPDYEICVFCGTFVSKKNTPDDFYSFKNYWHDRQLNKYGFPPIEQRAKNDFMDRIPFWYENIKELPIKSVLEIGGAHGGFLHYCKIRGIGKCTGIEIDKDTCKFAEESFGLDMICGEFPNIEINEQYDLVCAFDVLEHFKNPYVSLLKMKLLGNKVMIQTPCYRKEGLNFPHFNAEEHLFIFTETSLILLFRGAGLHITKSIKGFFANDITLIGESSNL
jgi:2-polyprenyl-3-methyl-5-hydroxy-6-metoxy-1,4-benzoquinol methylase